MHSMAIPLSELGKLLHWQFYHSLIVMFGISLIKVSIACFLLRLVAGKAYKIFLYCMIGKFPQTSLICSLHLHEIPVNMQTMESFCESFGIAEDISGNGWPWIGET
jgi:hypothetical protein